MNLLFAIKTLGRVGGGGGAERVLTYVASGLARRGYNVVIASYDRECEDDFYRVSPEVRRIRLGVGTASARTNVWSSLQGMGKLRRLIKGERPDAFIGFLNSMYIPAAVGLAGTGVPIVASEHIVYEHYQNRTLERVLMHLLRNRFTCITAISEKVRLTFPPYIQRSMEVIPNPVLPLTEGIADPVGGNNKILLSVGRLFPQKDQKTLIDAFGMLATEFPDWKLRIVGEGPLRGALESQVDRLGLVGRVELSGMTQDIARAYLSAQLYVMPSRFESFGLATAEALVHGLPSIGFADCPGTNEVIEHERNGLLVSGNDRPLALATGLRRIMSSPSLRLRLAGAAPISMDRYKLSNVLDAWEELLRAKVSLKQKR